MGSSRPTPAEEVTAALETFTFKTGVTEPKFRDALLAHLVSGLSVFPNREAGLHGQGTKADLHFEHRDEEFIITIMQGLSEQKVKTLLGEAVVIATALCFSDHAGTVNFFILVMEDERWKPEAKRSDMNILMQGMVFFSSSLKDYKKLRLRFHFAWCSPQGGQGLPLEATKGPSNIPECS